MGMMLIDKKLSAFLFNKTRRGLLTLLYGHPDESFYVNQILQALHAGSGAVQRELKIMTEAGIITRQKTGNLVYYRVNTKSPIFNELNGLIMKTTENTNEQVHTGDSTGNRFNISKRQLKLFCRHNHIKKLSLFGSVLREDFHSGSDIDILVEFETGHVPGFAIIDMENELSGLLGRKADIRTSADLSRYFRDAVVREARVEYEHTQL
jgi:uncharacterized protein